MKRFQTVLLLATFAAGPALMWQCEHPCATPVAEKAASDCHGTGTAAVTLVDGHDCGQHVIDTAPAVKGTRPELRPAAAPTTAFASGSALTRGAVAIATLLPTDTGPPMAGFALPLRI